MAAQSLQEIKANAEGNREYFRNNFEKALKDYRRALEPANKDEDEQQEYARLPLSQERFSRAILPIEKAISLLDKLNVETSDPIGYAHLLQDYMLALGKVGREEDAEKVSSRIDEIKIKNPNKKANFVAAKYSKSCESP